jgi:predicted ferric reductase
MLIKTKLVFEVKVKALIGSNIKIYFIFFLEQIKKQLFNYKVVVMNKIGKRSKFEVEVGLRT